MSETKPQYPRVHPREQQVSRAKAELGLLLATWAKEHDLTDAEFVHLVAWQLAFYAQGGIVAERKRRPRAPAAPPPPEHG